MNVSKLKPVIKYWDDGNKLLQYFVDANNNLQGECKSWYKDGQLRYHCFFENGEFHREYKSWYENGQLEVRCFYENGNAHGEYKKWHGNGQLYIHCFYENNIELDIPKKDFPKTKDEYILFCLKYGNLPLLGPSE